MTAAGIVMAAVLGLGPGDEVSDLLGRLGSGRAAEREEAAAQLVKRGRDALPALRGALKSGDPDLRERAAGLIETIDHELMLRPTLITLDYVDRPLGEVVGSIGEQAGVAIRLEPQGMPAEASGKVTLREPQPVPFWSALDRLCKAGELRYDASARAQIRGPVGMAFRGQGMVFSLVAGPPNASPTSDHGPFRVLVAQVYHSRAIVTDGNGVPGHLAMGMAPGGMRPGPVGPRPRGAAARPPAAVPEPSLITDLFFINLQVSCEHRLRIVANRDIAVVKVAEAVDDRGQSLLKDAGEREPRDVAARRFLGPALIEVSLNGLKYPDQPGRRIKTLRGVVPVTVAARRSDPLVVALEPDNFEKPVRVDDLWVTVSKPRAEADTLPTTIDVAFSDRAERPFAPAGPGAPPSAPSRSPDFEIEVIDAQGRVLNAAPQPAGVSQAGQVRLRMALANGKDVGPPAQLRYYRLTEATTEVPFEFHDLPMP